MKFPRKFNLRNTKKKNKSFSPKSSHIKNNSTLNKGANDYNNSLLKTNINKSFSKIQKYPENNASTLHNSPKIKKSIIDNNLAPNYNPLKIYISKKPLKNNKSYVRYSTNIKRSINYDKLTSNCYDSTLNNNLTKSFSFAKFKNHISKTTNELTNNSSIRKGRRSHLNIHGITGKYNNNYKQYMPQKEISTFINIKDLMILEEKLKEIIIAINKNRRIYNECLEFWNYYYNCSFYGKLEELFKTENDKNNIKISINYILLSVMICYDYSYEMVVLKKVTSNLIDIMNLIYRSLIIIYEHILSIVNIESKSNIWVNQLNQLVNNFNNHKDKINGKYTLKRSKSSPLEKIKSNIEFIVQNIRVLLKNYKTSRFKHLINIFKKINEKTYEEIDMFFRENILRIDKDKESSFESIFLEDNKYFQTLPAPYIKIKNLKQFSLILDLDETLVHFKINKEDNTEGTLQFRPGISPFLKEVGEYYELIIFTESTQEYGDLLIDAIEESNIYFDYRFYRQHTVIIDNDFVKDLNRIGRPLDKMIIVDDMPQNFRLQKENGINIKPFWGEDANDKALEELGKILVNIAKEGGDIRIGIKKYKDEIATKVTSEFSKSNNKYESRINSSSKKEKLGNFKKCESEVLFKKYIYN